MCPRERRAVRRFKTGDRTVKVSSGCESCHSDLPLDFQQLRGLDRGSGQQIYQRTYYFTAQLHSRVRHGVWYVIMLGS